MTLLSLLWMHFMIHNTVRQARDSMDGTAIHGH